MRVDFRFALLGFLILLFAAGPWLAPYNPVEQNRDIANMGPNSLHWMGTDEYGRDVLSRFLAGGSWSVLNGIAATAIGLTLGWFAGGLAGFKGGWTDSIIMRAGEATLSLPWLYLLVGIRAVLPLNMKPRSVAFILLLVFAFVSWAAPARLVRGMALTLSARGYVEAARGFGVPERKILMRHIFPGTFGILAAQGLVLFLRFVLVDVTLSFLGLGAGEPDPSWGALVAGLKQAYVLREQWWRILPGLFMLPLFLICAMCARTLAHRHRLAR